MAAVNCDYFWRDGFLVRQPRTTYEAKFLDNVGAQQGQPMFVARSANITALVEFDDHAQQVLDGIRSLGPKEVSNVSP